VLCKSCNRSKVRTKKKESGSEPEEESIGIKLH
jgi:hypothetical protein